MIRSDKIRSDDKKDETITEIRELPTARSGFGSSSSSGLYANGHHPFMCLVLMIDPVT